MEPGIYKIIWRINDSNPGSPWWNDDMEKKIGAVFTIWISVPWIPEVYSSWVERYWRYCTIFWYFFRESWCQKIASISQT